MGVTRYNRTNNNKRIEKIGDEFILKYEKS